MKKTPKIILILVIFILIVVYILYRNNYIKHKKYTNDYFNIETYKSKIDKDKDGIDDEDDGQHDQHAEDPLQHFLSTIFLFLLISDLLLSRF